MKNYLTLLVLVFWGCSQSSDVMPNESIVKEIPSNLGLPSDYILEKSVGSRLTFKDYPISSENDTTYYFYDDKGILTQTIVSSGWKTDFLVENKESKGKRILVNTTLNSVNGDQKQTDIYECDNSGLVHQVWRGSIQTMQYFRYDEVGRKTAEVEVPIFPLPMDSLTYLYLTPQSYKAHIWRAYMDNGIIKYTNHGEIIYTLSDSSQNNSTPIYPFHFGNTDSRLVSKITTKIINQVTREEYFRYSYNDIGLLTVKEFVSTVRPYKIQYFYKKKEQ